MVRAYGYIRVSSQGQVGGDGFKRQTDEIERYASKHNVEIVQVFQEEGVSGTKGHEDRPAFQEMVTAILRNGIDTIIIEGQDRLARSMQIQEALLAFLTSKGINLISARTEINITQDFGNDPMKKALVQIQGVFAELEKGLLVKKLRTSRDRIKAEKGKCEGRKAPQETEQGQEILKTIKKLRRKPRGGKRLPFPSIANQMNKMGLQTTSGKPWTPVNAQVFYNRYCQ